MALDQLIGQYHDRLALIRYHMPYPGADPFYSYDAVEDSQRISYYHVTATSHLFIDGIVDAGYSNAVWDSLFQLQMVVPSPMQINISGTYNITNLQAHLNIWVIATDEIAWNDLHFQCAMVENGINWVAPNGLHVHNQVMRDMVPDGLGEAFTIANHDSVLFARDILVAESLIADSCEFIIFVQADSSKDVLQAGRISLPELTRTGVQEDPGNLPVDSRINACYPNPFNASVMINYSLCKASDVAIDIYNLLGERVATLRDGLQQAGEGNVVWDASTFPSGIYFASLEGGRLESVKLVLLR